MMFKHNNNLKSSFQWYGESGAGFTLIELIVVIAVFTILTGITILNFFQLQDNFALSRATYKFEQDLRRTQQMALSSKEFVDSNGISHPVVGYGVYVDIGSNNKQYIIYADSVGEPNQWYDACCDYVVETITLEKGVFMKDTLKDAQGTFESALVIDINFDAQFGTMIRPDASQSFSTDAGGILFALISDDTQTKYVYASKYGVIEQNQY